MFSERITEANYEFYKGKTPLFSVVNCFCLVIVLYTAFQPVLVLLCIFVNVPKDFVFSAYSKSHDNTVKQVLHVL